MLIGVAKSRRHPFERHSSWRWHRVASCSELCAVENFDGGGGGLKMGRRRRAPRRAGAPCCPGQVTEAAMWARRFGPLSRLERSKSRRERREIGRGNASRDQICEMHVSQEDDGLSTSPCDALGVSSAVDQTDLRSSFHVIGLLTSGGNQRCSSTS